MTSGTINARSFSDGRAREGAFRLDVSRTGLCWAVNIRLITRDRKLAPEGVAFRNLPSTLWLFQNRTLLITRRVARAAQLDWQSLHLNAEN